MSAQPDFDRLLDSWLIEGPSELSDRAASRISQAIDDSQRRPRFIPRPQALGRLLAAAGSLAAVALIAVIGIGLLTGGRAFGPGATPSPAATPTASPTPSFAPPPRQATVGDIEPGRYWVRVGGYRFMFTITGSGWSAVNDLFFQGDDSRLAIFAFEGGLTSLYRRACASSGTEFDPGESVGELAEALASLEDFDTTEPVDVTVSGYHGKRVTLTVPMDVDVRSTDCDGGKYSLREGRWYQAPGQTDDMWILDLDGERQVILVSKTPRTPASVVEQLDEMMATLEIEPL